MVILKKKIVLIVLILMMLLSLNISFADTKIDVEEGELPFGFDDINYGNILRTDDYLFVNGSVNNNTAINCYDLELNKQWSIPLNGVSGRMEHFDEKLYIITQSNVYIISYTGEIISSASLNVSGEYDLFTVIKTEDRVYVAGSSWTSDDFGGSSYHVIIFDENLNYIAQVTTDKKGDSFYHPYKTDGGIIIGLGQSNEETYEDIVTYYKVASNGIITTVNLDDYKYNENVYDEYIITRENGNEGSYKYKGNTFDIDADIYFFQFINEKTIIGFNQNKYQWVLYHINGYSTQIKVNALSTEILKAAGKFGGEITEEEYEKIKVLDLSYSNMTNLNGLDKLINLKTLDISYNDILDYDVLMKLPLLESINVTGNPISEASLKQLNDKGIRVINVTDVPTNDTISNTIDQTTSDETLTDAEKAFVIQSKIESYLLESLSADLSKDSLNNLDQLLGIESNAANLKNETLTSFIKNGVDLSRQLTIEINIPMAGTLSGVVKIPSELGDLESINAITLTDQEFDLTVYPQHLKNGLNTKNEIGDLTVEKSNVITVSPNNEAINKFYNDMLNMAQMNIKNNSGDGEAIINKNSKISYDLSVSSVNLSMEQAQPVMIALESENNPYNCIMEKSDQGYKEIGGKYNEESGKLEAIIVNSGEYFVLENKKSVEDIEAYDPETRLAIEVLLSKNLLNIDETLFNPESYISREELTFAIVRLIDMLNPDAKCSFTDVEKDSHYYPYIGSSQEAGIIAGYEDNTFRPENNILRQEIITVASAAAIYKNNYRFVKDEEQYLSLLSNADEIENWARPYVAIALREGMLVSDAEQLFIGSDPVTRVEAAKILYKLYKKL